MSDISSYWLGPSRGRWAPSTWAEVVDAAASGLLDETSWVELKAMIAPGKPANVELSRDLASLSLRAGLMIVGIEAAGTGAGKVAGVELAGYRDRIDQVAGTRIDPPLYVDTREIPDPDRPGCGVVLVSVPATGPHQADERYWGRGDTGKRVLHDAEVREHFGRRRVGDADLSQELRDSERDYLAHPGVSDGAGTARARLFMRAVPLDARPECLLELIQDSVAGQRVRDLANQVGAWRPGQLSGSPLAGTYTWASHARGRVMSTFIDAKLGGGGGLHVIVGEDGIFDVIQDQIFCPPQSRLDAQRAVVPSLLTGLVLHTVHDVVGLAGQLADQSGAYQGLWRVGVRVSDLTGYYDYFQLTRGLNRLPAGYSESHYENVVLTSTAQMSTQPWTVTEQLLGRLVRGLSVAPAYLPYEPGSTAIAFT